MRRRESPFRGPEVATRRDIDAINELFSQAFSDRYQRDGMAGVRVPPLNPQVWRYALDDAGSGAMVWRDAGGALAAFNIAHCSGTEGWLGPLAVRTEWQGHGLGTRIVEAGIAFVRGHGATTIGLETMPRTVDNIGFYSRLGFRPGYLTVTVARVPTDPPLGATIRLSTRPHDQETLLQECAALSGRLRAGADYQREIRLTAALGLGDTTLMIEEGRLRGFALWHGAALAIGRPREELRVLKLVAEDSATFSRLVTALDGEARRDGLGRCSYRVQTAAGAAFHELIRRGSQVVWTDLRMTLDGYPEPPASPGVVFSNWEI